MTKKIISVLTCLLLYVSSFVYAQNINSNTIKVADELGRLYSVKDGEINIPIKFKGSGGSDLKSLGITVSVNGIGKQYTVVPESGTEDMINIKVPAPANAGIYDVKVTVNKVNGEGNGSNENTATGRLVNVTRNVDHKVVFEEFTGLGCGWCPRGLVALEEARQTYGRNIVLISAHFDDPMSCRDYNIMRQNQLPSSNIDRTYNSIDPYFGTSGGGMAFGINEDIKKCAATVPVAEVKVDAYMDGDKIIATSDVKFLYTGTGDYAVAFVLTEDGVHNEKWKQLNNYWQIEGMGFIEEDDPFFERWIKGDNYVTGYVYDDVAVAAQGVKYGIDGSIPESFVEEESNKYQVEFDIARLKKIQNRKNLNVCAFLYDRAGRHIINADYMSFEHETGIDGVDADSENVSETARYTVDGCKINNKTRGINIIKYSDGSVRKVIVR